MNNLRRSVPISQLTRRSFLKNTVAAGVIAGSGRLPLSAEAAKKSATDWVTLGKSGLKVTRLAFGTGTFGGRIQRELGQERFTGLVRHAYDRGIRFFETAEAYTGMPEMLGNALRGLPRDSYRLMTKYRLRGTDDPKEKMDRFRKVLNTEYFDILLLHCVRLPNWAEQFKRVRDEFFPKSLVDPDEIRGLDGLMAEAVTLKFIPAPLTKEQVGELVQIVK